MAVDRPTQFLHMDDVLGDVPQFGSDREALSVSHLDKMLLMKGEELSGYIRNLASIRSVYLRTVM